MKKTQWSKKYDSCSICKTTERLHHGKGVCLGCRHKRDDYKAYQIIYKRNTDAMKRHNQNRKTFECRKKDSDRLKIYRKKNKDKIRVYKLMANLGGSRNKKQIIKDIKIIKNEINKINRELKS